MAGLIGGREKVPGNSPKNDIKTIKGSPGEVIVDKETLARGPKAWVQFINDSLKNPGPRKTHFDEGGEEEPSAWENIKSAFDDPSPAPSRPAPSLDREKAKSFSSVFNSENYDGGGAVSENPPMDVQQYLKEKQSAPSAPMDVQQYLKEKGASSQDKPESTLGDKARTGLENYGDAMTMGYLPHLQAATSHALFGSPYTEERDANIKRIGEESEDNPKSAMAGKVAGFANGALATPEIGALKGAGLLKSGARGAIEGAGYGALQNPGDKEGEVNPLQAEDRLENAKTGAKFGAAAGAATNLIGKGIGALKNSADTAQELANSQAVRAAGSDLKTTRALAGRGKIDDVGQFALDKGIVQAGDKVEDVAEKAAIARKAAGKKLDDIYGQAKNVIDPADEAKFRGFNPVRDKEAILNSVEEKLGDSPDKRSAMHMVEGYLDQLADDHGDKLLDPKTANNIKTQIDQQINYSRNPLTKNPASEKGYSAMRDFVSDAVDRHIEDLGNAVGDPKLANKLSDANREYGLSKSLQTMAEDRVNRHLSNKMFGLTDTIAGAGGAAVGGGLGAAAGHDGKSTAEGAAAGLLAGLAHKKAMQYGPGILAGAANAAAKAAPYTAAPAGEMLSKIPPDVLQKMAIQGLLKKKQGENENPK